MQLIMQKEIGQLGRLVIPQNIREMLNMKVGTKVGLFIDDGRLILKPVDNCEQCIVCGEKNELFGVLGQAICVKCAQSISEKVKEDKHAREESKN